MTQIANPIYDVVFRYLMEDKKIAKQILSGIIGERIMELEFRPQEYSNYRGKNRGKEGEKMVGPLTVYRIDFSAKIRTATGYRLALIEIQKAKFASDIMRFRRYLGSQYSNPENIYYETLQGEKVRKALPLITIYLLGHQLSEYPGVPVIKVQRNYLDNHRGDPLEGNSEFIESLTHDSFVIQIPELKEKRRNDLEKLLSIFDQSNIHSNQHILNVKEEAFLPEYRHIIRRLQVAIAEPEIQEMMYMEDEMLGDLQSLERKVEEKDKKIEEEKKKVEEEKRKVEEEKRKVEERDRELEQLKQKLQQMKKT